MPKKKITKHSVLSNYKYVVLAYSQEAPYFYFLKDKEELDRWVGNDSIKDGDLVIELNSEVLKVATKVERIDIK